MPPCPKPSGICGPGWLCASSAWDACSSPLFVCLWDQLQSRVLPETYGRCSHMAETAGHWAQFRTPCRAACVQAPLSGRLAPALLALPFPCGYTRLRAVLGEQALASACSGRAGRLPHLLLFLRLPEGRARPGRVQPCSPQHACLIEEWDGEDPTLTVHRRQLHTHAVEGEPGALVGAGGPVQPLLSSKLRPPVQGACLVVCLSLRGMAGRWAALVSGGSRGGPVLSCPEVSCLRGQAYEVGGCHVHILGVKSSDSGRWLRCRGW